MRFRFFIPVFFLLSVLGCIPENPEPPQGVLDKETMTDVIEEVQLIEAFRQRGLVLPPDMDPEREAEKMYARLFDKYGITKEEFKNSYAWYEANPGVLGEVYDAVLVRLSEKQANVRNPEAAKAVAKRDSIRAQRDTLSKPE